MTHRAPSASLTLSSSLSDKTTRAAKIGDYCLILPPGAGELSHRLDLALTLWMVPHVWLAITFSSVCFPFCGGSFCTVFFSLQSIVLLALAAVCFEMIGGVWVSGHRRLTSMVGWIYPLHGSNVPVLSDIRKSRQRCL